MSVSFEPAKTYQAGGDDVQRAAIADLNGDGVPDLVVPTAEGLAALLGNGVGGFNAPTLDTAVGGSGAVSVGDLNSDGHPDVVDGGAVLLGNGAGGFGAPTYLATPVGIYSQAIGDFNADGKLDVVTAEQGFTVSGLSVFLGDGAGGFSADSFTPLGGFPFDLLGQLGTADVNGDGRTDVVAATSGMGFPGGDVTFFGDGTGELTASNSYSVNLRGGPFVLADVNGDGRPDLITTEGSQTIDVLLNTGSGFAAPVTINAGEDVLSLSVADVNGDGHPDLVVGRETFQGVGSVAVLTGDGKGGFAAPVVYADPGLTAVFQGEGPVFVGTADLNGDGRPDIVVANADGSVNVLLNDTAPCYLRGTRLLTVRGEVPVEALCVGDLVVTMLGRGAALKPVRWLGHRRLALTHHPRPDEANPIRIRAGALGDGQPLRDLLVSPAHRLRLDETLIRAVDLVNGATIVQEAAATVEYWHVELNGHDILLAEGCEAESYQDTGNRADFDNGVAIALHPVLDGDAAEPCLPYALPGSALRDRLARRAEALGWSRCRAPLPFLIAADGIRIQPVRRGDRYRFTLPANCTEAWLCSRAARPCDTDPLATDRRCLGLPLVQMRFDQREIPLHDTRLTEGFCEPECDASGWTWRWTNGRAHLPIAALVGSVASLELTLDHQVLQYWDAPAIAPVAHQEALVG